jgi:hypothetical protein
MRLPRLKWLLHPNILILIALIAIFVGATLFVYRPRIVRNSPYLLCIIFDEQIPPFRDHCFTVSTRGKIEWSP